MGASAGMWRPARSASAAFRGAKPLRSSAILVVSLEAASSSSQEEQGNREARPCHDRSCPPSSRARCGGHVPLSSTPLKGKSYPLTQKDRTGKEGGVSFSWLKPKIFTLHPMMEQSSSWSQLNKPQFRP